MLQRLYINNFRCLDNFEFKPGSATSALLVGKNGSGKTTMAQALKIFQAIGRGVNRAGHLVKERDFSLGRTSIPLRLEMEVKLGSHAFRYNLAFDYPEGFREPRVVEEELHLDEALVYTRSLAQVTLNRLRVVAQQETKFNIDWHLIALPVIQDPSASSVLSTFRDWLARMVLLAPIPRFIQGEAKTETLDPDEDGSNFADWLSGLLAQYPAAYAMVSKHLQQIIPDLEDFRFVLAGRETKSLLVRFKSNSKEYECDFDALSDGEKCFFLCAVVLAANTYYGPLFAFWDEPDNYLSLSEVSFFIMALRQGFNKKGQILMTSHNEEAVRRFSNDSTWVLGRKSHLEPSQIRLLNEMPKVDDLIQSLICGDLEP